MVFHMVCIAPTGNRRERPMVAESADLALQDWRAEIKIEERGQTEGFTYEVSQVDDPDGSYERALNDAERRLLETEFYRLPRVSKGKR